MAPARRPGAGVVALLGVSAGLGLMWWILLAPGFTIAPQADRNVLLVTIDTLRADALGSYGGRAATPALDGLAAQGARFTFAHAHAVLTLPSHASILTGRYPYEHGVRDNAGYRIAPNETTLATRLKGLGFATGAFVSAFPLDQRYGLQAGFDVYDDRVSEVGSTTNVVVPERRADATVTPAIEWIGRQRDKWFAWVHVFDPHAPYQPPPEWLARYPSDAYAAEVAWTDAALAPLFARLAELTRPTLVVVTADHGESLGDHGELTHGVFAYESTLQVPLIVADVQPGGRTRRGTTISRPARHVDILPTVMAAVGTEAAGLPGTALFSAPASGLPATYFESMMPTLARGWAPLRGVIVGREKFIDLPIAELYALDRDPREQQNLASVKADRITVVANVLRGFNVAPPNQPGEESAAARARLQALGYVSGSPAPARDRYTEADDPKTLIDLDKMLHRASELFAAGRPGDAVAVYREVILRRADTADAYRNLAFVFWQTGRPAEAIATLEAAVRQGVKQRDIVVKLGTYLAETGASAKAMALLETLPRDDTEALNALGIAYAQAGRAADAKQLFSQALALDATNGLAHQNLGTLALRAGDLAAAETALRQAVAIDPSLPGAHTALGVVLVKTGRRADAVTAWTRAVELEATEYDALYNLTIELAAAGRLDEARKYGQRYISKAPPALYARDIEAVRRAIK